MTCAAGFTLTTAGLCTAPVVSCDKAGYRLVGGACKALRCLTDGCGNSVADIVCTEFTDTARKCRCPGATEPSTVNVGVEFAGCEGPTPTVNEVINDFAEEHVQAFIEKKIPQVITIRITGKSENSFSFTLDSTVPATDLLEALKQAIADLIGNDVTKAQVHLDIKNAAKRATADITATIDETPSNAVMISGLLGMLISIVVSMF